MSIIIIMTAVDDDDDDYDNGASAVHYVYSTCNHVGG